MAKCKLAPPVRNFVSSVGRLCPTSCSTLLCESITQCSQYSDGKGSSQTCSQTSYTFGSRWRAREHRAVRNELLFGFCVGAVRYTMVGGEAQRINPNHEAVPAVDVTCRRCGWGECNYLPGLKKHFCSKCSYYFKALRVASHPRLTPPRGRRRQLVTRPPRAAGPAMRPLRLLPGLTTPRCHDLRDRVEYLMILIRQSYWKARTVDHGLLSQMLPVTHRRVRRKLEPRNFEGEPGLAAETKVEASLGFPAAFFNYYIIYAAANGGCGRAGTFQ
eukprot:g64590.t1